MRLKSGRGRTNWRRTGPRILLAFVLVAAYAAYWFLTPTSVQVQSVATSATGPSTMVVTLHNPSFKFVGGEIVSITTEVDLAIPGQNRTVLLQAIPRTYYFFIAPQLSQTFSIPFNSRVLIGMQYDITIHIDGGLDQTLTVTLQ